MSNFQLNVKVNGGEQAIKTIGDIERALEATKNELKGVDIGTEAFNKLTNQAKILQGELKRTFEDATQFDASLGQLTTSVTRLGSSVAAGFAVATSAIGLFGNDTEELTQAQVKAQQALAIAFSATTIATNAANLSADIKLVTDRLQLGITNLLTGAFGRETTVKAASAVASGTATVAQRALNAAMSANPVLLLVAGLGLLIGALVAFSSESEDAEAQTKNNEAALASLNEEIDRGLTLRREEITRERELINLKGRLLEADAKTESERLKIRQQTLIDLQKTQNKELVDIQKTNENKLLLEQKFQVDFTLQSALFKVQQEKLLQDRVDTSITEETRYYAKLKELLDAGTIDFAEALRRKLKFQQDFNKQRGIVLDAETIKANNALLKQIADVKKSQADVKQLQKTSAGELELIQKQITATEKRESDDRVKTNKENLKKRQDDLNAFNDNQVTAIQKRSDEIKKIERELQDFLIERISEGLTQVNTDIDGTIQLIQRSAQTFALLNTETGKVIKSVEELTEAEKENARIITVNNEDIIGGLDERIVQLNFLRDRQLEDSAAAFNADIENFRKTEAARLDSNGKRIISDSQINAAVATQTEKFNEEQLLRTNNFNLKIEAVTQQRADKVAEIEEILQQEIAFGDNATNDNRTRLLLETIDEEILFSQRRLDNERIVNIELIRERQAAEAKKRQFLKKSLLEEEAIQLTLSLKSVQGTEEQKARQREELVKASNDRIRRINKQFRDGEAEAEQQNLQEISEAQLARINAYAQQVFAFLGQITALTSAIEEGNRISLENQLIDIRDSFVERQNVATEGFNNELAALNQRFETGQISQDQYNSSVAALNEKLAEDSVALQAEQREIELDLKEKAFENEKKFRIANVIISGAQGALQAFTSAFSTLPPPANAIVGSALAALVGVTTGLQVANIRKTKFDRGAPATTPKLGTVNASGASGAGNIQNLASSGGLTQFSPDLTGQPNNNNNNNDNSGARQSDPLRVFVLESDITGAQNRVSVAESSATFG